MDVTKKIDIFLFRFSLLFPSRICIGRAWLFFSYRLTTFSLLFLIWDKKCFIYPFPPNRQPQTWRFFVFYPHAFSIKANLSYQMYISQVPQLTCIWMSGARGWLTNVHLIRKIDINYKKGHLLLTSVLRLVVPINSGKLPSNWKERGLCYNDVFVSRPNREWE